MQQAALRERAVLALPVQRQWEPRRTPAGIPADDRIQSTLDTARARLADFDVRGAMDLVCDELTAMRRTLAPEDWQGALAQCRADGLRALIHEAPITRRAFARPRGYAGDAETLDMIYGQRALPEGLTPLAAALYGYEMQMTAAVSVRVRRELLASLIDEVALERRMPRVLSIACGHLREAELSQAVAGGAVGAFDALDQDEESLALVRREHAARSVRAIHGSVRTLLNGQSQFDNYDLVYAAGLYDYLDATVSARLTATLFQALAPGGRLLVANFAHGVREAAYMETYMDWPLVYRSEADVARFDELVPREEVAEKRLFSDAARNVLYLELRRN
jgi:SAM-dependent methyltransferase